MLHFLIVVPYYFFGALTSLFVLMIISRVLRLSVSINVLVGMAIVIGVFSLIIPLATDMFDLAHLSLKPMLVLATASFLLAAVDVLLRKVLPVRLDDELREI